jgi:hypothetical protein
MAERIYTHVLFKYYNFFQSLNTVYALYVEQNLLNNYTNLAAIVFVDLVGRLSTIGTVPVAPPNLVETNTALQNLTALENWSKLLFLDSTGSLEFNDELIQILQLYNFD